MTRLACAALIACAASMATAENSRQLGAHIHGVGQLDIAFDGAQIAVAFHAPGADIAGFEYAPQTPAARAKVDEAVATLARPLDLINLPAAAGCTVIQTSASLQTDGRDDPIGHDQALFGRKQGYDGPATPTHTEFHAEYLLHCANPSAVNLIHFPYFDIFANARALEIQVISDRGAFGFEVARDVPTLDLRDMF